MMLAWYRQISSLSCSMPLTESSAYFDEHGNIMVTNEGTLPSQRIAKRFVLQVCGSQSIHCLTTLTATEI